MLKLYEIGAGTSEIRRMLIGRELFRETDDNTGPRMDTDEHRWSRRSWKHPCPSVSIRGSISS